MPGAVRSVGYSSFEPAKALLRWQPLPRPRVLPSPDRGLPFRVATGVRMGWCARWENTIGWVGCCFQPFTLARLPNCDCRRAMANPFERLCWSRMRMVPYGHLTDLTPAGSQENINQSLIDVTGVLFGVLVPCYTNATCVRQIIQCHRALPCIRLGVSLSL